MTCLRARASASGYALVVRWVEEGRFGIGAFDALLRAWSWGTCDEIIGDQRQDPV